MAINPYEVAAKYGYDAQTFANDPNFESYWSNKTEEQLLSGLKARRDWGDTYRTEQNKRDKGTNKESERPTVEKKPSPESATSEFADAMSEDEIDALLDELQKTHGLTNDQLTVMRTASYENFGNKQYSVEELNTVIENAALDAETNSKPYYENLRADEMDSLKSGFQDIRDSAQSYKESEALNYADTLAKTQKSLRQRGLSFSGAARKELGADSAIGGGKENFKGRLNTAREDYYGNQMDSYKAQGTSLGKAGEKYFGSGTVKGLDRSIPGLNGNESSFNSNRNIDAGRSTFELDRLKNNAYDTAQNFAKKIK